jgi:hypothetical protein
MEKQGIIEKSNSPWSSPVCLVKKTGATNKGEWRFCVDYRKLNAVTKKCSWPLPNINDFFQEFGLKYITSLDLRSGYHQVPLTERAKERSAFCVTKGLYQFNVLPFGMVNAPATFQRLLETTLQSLNWKICLVYLDDILVWAPTFEEHIENLRLVFDRLQWANLKLNPKKCSFFQKETHYLGHKISADGLKISDKNKKAIELFPAPTDAKELKAFLGLANFYRKLIFQFAHIAEPLQRLLKKDTPFDWTTDCQTAFDTLKTKLTSDPIIRFPDFSRPFRVYTDASSFAIGYILGQTDDEGRDYVCLYGSRTLTPTERNYSVTEREGLALIQALKETRGYLGSKEFTVITDHESLKYLMNLKDPHGRLARWALFLQEFNFKIQYVPGKKHHVDALSRTVLPEPPISALNIPFSNLAGLKRAQREDPSLNPIIQFITQDVLPDSRPHARTIMLKHENFIVEDGILYYIGPSSNDPVKRLAVPKSIVTELLLNAHSAPSSAHFGINKTYAKLRRNYYWSNMYTDCVNFIKSCEDCQSRKLPPRTPRAPLIPIAVESPWVMCSIDCVGPLPTTASGNKYLVVAVDYLTGYPEARALPSIDAPLIAKFIYDDIITRHGAPRVLLSDQAKNFRSKLVGELSKRCNIKQASTTAYHPICNGKVEKMNHTIITAISKYVNERQNDWDQFLTSILYAIRITPNQSSLLSPFYLLYGYEAFQPHDLALRKPEDTTKSADQHLEKIIRNLEVVHAVARDNIAAAQLKNKVRYDAIAKEPTFRIGDLVLLYVPHVKPGKSRKFLHPYRGPYQILQQVSPVNYRIRELTGNRRITLVVHANRLKLYFPPPIPPHPNPDQEAADQYDSEDDTDVADNRHNRHVPPTGNKTPETNEANNNHNNNNDDQDEHEQRHYDSDDTIIGNAGDSTNSDDELTPNDDEIVSDDETHPVEAILDDKLINGKRHYLIKWESYDHSHNSWLPKHDVGLPLIRAYEKCKHKKSKKQSYTNIY